MMHEGQIISQLDAQEKEAASVDDLLALFSGTKGATLSDRSLLA